MDLVYRRYQTLFFLDSCIENNQFSEFVRFIIKKNNEDKKWDIYLATVPLHGKSYKEWDEEQRQASTKIKTKEANMKMSKSDFDAIINKSENILRGFKPPQKGGSWC